MQLGPQAVPSLSGTQASPHRWKPVSHAKPHFVPSHEVRAPFGTSGQGVQALPHELTLAFRAHTPPQSCRLGTQASAQLLAASMQTPAHSFFPAAQAPPHTPAALHVAEPPMGASQGVHARPHVATSVSLTHASPHRW
jgi:hypothetical protein